jgi:hypothetical protein
MGGTAIGRDHVVNRVNGNPHPLGIHGPADDVDGPTRHGSVKSSSFLSPSGSVEPTGPSSDNEPICLPNGSNKSLPRTKATIFSVFALTMD